MSVIPHPVTLDEIKALLKEEKERNPDFFRYWERYTVEWNVMNKLHPNGWNNQMLTGRIDDSNYGLFNAYSLIRAMNQSNESCNKVWATIELLHALSPLTRHYSDYIRSQEPELGGAVYYPLCNQFDVQYCGGTIIPTLYYAQLSALISLLSSFGCISIRDYITNNSYNIVRLRDEWIIYERKDYIYKLTDKHPSYSWHMQLIQLLQGFRDYVTDFPDIDIEKTRELGNERNITHYEILASVSAKRVMGLDKYFELLPLVLNTINYALTVISKIYESSYLAGCNRFKVLHSKVSLLYKEHGKDYPNEILPVSY